MLSAARAWNGGFPQPIAVSEIFALADHLWLNREDALYFVQGLDETFIEEVGKKRDQEAKAAQNRARNTGRHKRG